MLQEYVPHIALMYAAGLQEAETIFCDVSGVLDSIIRTEVVPRAKLSELGLFILKISNI